MKFSKTTVSGLVSSISSFLVLYHEHSNHQGDGYFLVLTLIFSVSLVFLGVSAEDVDVIIEITKRVKNQRTEIDRLNSKTEQDK